MSAYGFAPTLLTGQATVATTATQIAPANANRKSIIVANNGAATIFLGQDNTVTTGNGHALPAGASIKLDRYQGAVFGIVASGTQPATYAAEV